MEPPNDPAIGQTVDGYRIEAVLGRGGKQRQRGARQRACHAPNAAYRRAGVSRDGLRNNISNARRGVVLCQSPILLKRRPMVRPTRSIVCRPPSKLESSV